MNMNTTTTRSRRSDAPSSGSRLQGTSQQINPIEDTVDYLRAYAREKPEVAALWCFGVGFLLGWKLKPW